MRDRIWYRGCGMLVSAILCIGPASCSEDTGPMVPVDASVVPTGDIEVLVRDLNTGIHEAQRMVIRSEAAWVAFWEDLHGSGPPASDLRVVALGSGNAGYVVRHRFQTEPGGDRVVLERAGPVHVGHLFEGLHSELMGVLERLGPTDWERPTSAGAWRVRDVVAHMLDGDLRRLSIHRDGHLPPVDRRIEGYDQLLGYLDELNAQWVTASERLSPELMVELLAQVGPELAAFLSCVDPFAPAPLGVAWAGEGESLNWLDLGREYTERWHHQDQLREALELPRLDGRQWLDPVLRVSLHALPFGYRDVDADAQDAVELVTTGEVSGTWSLVCVAAGWELFSGATPQPACRITLDSAVAARLLLNRLPRDSAQSRVQVEGRDELAAPFLAARAVMV